MNADSFDPSSIDCDAFFRELRAIRLEAEANLGEEDIAHLKKTMRYGRIATAVGLATAWFPNPVSMVGLAIGRSTNWFVMHHIAHRGYDRVPGIPAKLTSRVYGKGWRRFIDWPEWMLPEAWKYEHNVLHHTNTSEAKDPDLVERNMIWLRDWDIPKPAKLALVALLGMTWKPAYYAPSTVHTYLSRGESLGFTGEDVLSRPPGYKRMLWLQCYAPYALLTFGALPAAYLPLGPLAAASAFINSFGAEALTNLHSFAVITPNHTGEDLYAFETPAASKAEAAVRQVLGSVNYATGTEAIDFGHMWLNYQIEHHLFPDLPMLRYRQIQPKVKALCEKHGIPYVQESLWKRVKQLVGISIGTKSMKRVASIGRRRDVAAAAE